METNVRTTPKQYTVEEIRQQVRTDASWATRAIVVLYRQQTFDEQMEEQTKHHNGVGFNALDAEILSSFARRVQSNRPLTDKQLAVAFKKLPKYAAQLHRIAYGS